MRLASGICGAAGSATATVGAPSACGAVRHGYIDILRRLHLCRHGTNQQCRESEEESLHELPVECFCCCNANHSIEPGAGCGLGNGGGICFAFISSACRRVAS